MISPSASTSNSSRRIVSLARTVSRSTSLRTLTFSRTKACFLTLAVSSYSSTSATLPSAKLAVPVKTTLPVVVSLRSILNSNYVCRIFLMINYYLKIFIYLWFSCKNFPRSHFLIKADFIASVSRLGKRSLYC